MSEVGTNDALSASASANIAAAAAVIRDRQDGLAAAVSAVQGSCEGSAAQACVEFAASMQEELDALAQGASVVADDVTSANSTFHEADDASASNWEEVG